MKLFLASNNAHKAAELAALAARDGLAAEIISARAAGGMPAVAEDAGTFAGNARKKARALRAHLPTDAWALADDSGLCVDALGGGPGVESANYAGPGATDAANQVKLVAAMRDVSDARRGAHFICVLLLAGPDGSEHVFEGRCAGWLLREPRGAAGFGYDPLFVPDGHAATFAEMAAAEKNLISHRFRAWQALAEWLRANAPR
jgi:XTP/dITP diphosphohydrolase